MDEPLLTPESEFYFKAFWDLNTTRQLGMTPGPIPYDRIMGYGRDFGLDADNVKALGTIIREMDLAYLKWNADHTRN